MLLRVILALEKPMEQRIRRLTSRSDVVLETVETPRKLWERITRKSADVLLSSTAFIKEEPDPAKVRILRELPDSPYIVALTEVDDAAVRAQHDGGGDGGGMDGRSSSDEDEKRDPPLF